MSDAQADAFSSDGVGRFACAWRWCLVALAASFSLYLVSLAPGVVWQDNGKAQIRILQHDIRGENGLALGHLLYYLLAIAAKAFLSPSRAATSSIPASLPHSRSSAPSH